MGFIVMVLSAIIGILLVVMGGIHIKNKQGRLIVVDLINYQNTDLLACL